MLFPLVACPGALFTGLQVTRLSQSLAFTQAAALCPHRKGGGGATISRARALHGSTPARGARPRPPPHPHPPRPEKRPPPKGTKRYRQFVEYYAWKLQKRNARNVGVRVAGGLSELAAMWLLARQLLRVLAALHAALATLLR